MCESSLSGEVLQGLNNSVSVHQYQDENHVKVLQRQIGALPNNLQVLQDGCLNSCYIHQTGRQLDTHLQQLNSNNTANLWSLGQKIQLVASQIGYENSLNCYIENAGNLARVTAMLQEGDNNKIELSLLGNGIANSSVEQRVEIIQKGNAHELNAHMESFGMPIQIEQLAGLVGEGMKVDVSTSAFTMP